MGFVLEVTRKHDPHGAEMEYVSRDEITLGTALEMIVIMFHRAHRPWARITQFGPGEVAIFFAQYIDIIDGKPVVKHYPVLGYDGGFGFRFTAQSDEDNEHLMEMLNAYLAAYPHLAAYEASTTLGARSA